MSQLLLHTRDEWDPAPSGMDPWVAIATGLPGLLLPAWNQQFKTAAPACVLWYNRSLSVAFGEDGSGHLAKLGSLRNT